MNNPTSNSNEQSASTRETGFYWVKTNVAWHITQYYSRENLFYFPGYFEGIEPNQLHEIDPIRLDKKFEGHKRKSPYNKEQAELVRQEGYYWVMHDAMWFATYYLPSEDEFYFPGQQIGFGISDLQEIDEQQIERNETYQKSIV